jgi:toxin ParE1/3/4
MTFKVQITLQAEEDLRGIFEYIAFDLMAPENAVKQIGRIEKQIYNLDIFPERFKVYEQEPWKSLGLRFVAVDNYMIFYIIDVGIKSVKVVRVMYCGRNIEEQFRI